MGASVVTLAPAALVLLLLVGALGLAVLAADRAERRRDERVFRQVAVTDAIHRELGAVAAPVVKHRGSGWRVEIAVALDEPATVGRIVGIAHAALRRVDARRPGEVAIVLTARVDDRLANVGRRFAAPEREAATWTGPITSRARS